MNVLPKSEQANEHNSTAKRSIRRPKSQIVREQHELHQKAVNEIDQLYAGYVAKVPEHDRSNVGVIYARSSTRFHDSIADQVRTMLERAPSIGVFVPRELIFFDLAVKGSKRERVGLSLAEKALQDRRAETFLLFSTSRLFRRIHHTLAFVDRIHRVLGVRCIFVSSNVDTNDKETWEMLLSVDQWTVTMNTTHIQSAHKGLMSKLLVIATITCSSLAVLG